MALRKLEKFVGPKATTTVYRDVEWEEYRVKTAGQKGTGYHTNDKQDAMDTARSIAGIIVDIPIKPMVIPPFKSICLCGHTGDGAYSMHGGMIGHGPCSADGCACKKFSWRNFI